MSRHAFCISGLGDKDDPRNYFPFSDNTLAWEASAAAYPSPHLTFDELFEFSWRAKRLVVSLSGTTGMGGVVATQVSWPMYGNRTVLIGPSPYDVENAYISDEQRIRFDYQHSFFISVDEPFVGGGPDGYAFYASFYPEVVRYYEPGNYFYFSLYVDTSPIGGFNTTFMGYPVGTGSGTLNADITIAEWWPYDNGSGPIWDSATGAQLITPVPVGL